MAGIADMLISGFNQGTALRQNREAEERQSKLASLYSSALSGGDRSAILPQMAAIDPESAMRADQAFNQQEDRRAGKLREHARLLASLPPQMRPQAYASMVPELQQMGLGDGLPPQWSDELMPTVEAIANSGTGSGNNVQSRFVNERGEVMLVLRNGEVVSTGQRADPQRWFRDLPGMPPQVVDEHGGVNLVGQPNLVGAVIQQESGGNPNAVSPKGARGLMQVMPATGEDPGFGVAPLRDGSPQENVRFGSDYLEAMMERYGNQELALAAYNAGPGRVDEALRAAGGDPQRAIAMLPQETQQYVPRVLARARPSEAQVAAEQEAAKRNVALQFAPAEAAANAERERLAAEAKAGVERGQEQRQRDMAFSQFQTAMQATESALRDTATNPVAGAIPAVTANQQIAEGAVAAMAPILKQLFRSAGEGVFTDKDQELLMAMMPTRSDHPEAVAAKLTNIRAIVAAKLGQGGAPADAQRSNAVAADDPLGIL